VSYRAHSQESRLVSIDEAKNIFASVRVTTHPEGSIATAVEGSADPPIFFNQINESIGSLEDHHAYHMPFLFLEDGLPWIEANSYLYSLVVHKHPNNRPTDHARFVASKLLDYKIFCENNNLDWLDFSGKRLSNRPSYKYYHHLLMSTGLSAAVVNQYTGAVYKFYQYVAQHWHDIDINRVDSVELIRIYIKGSTGADTPKLVNRRSQTKTTPPTPTAPIGYIREDGEVLRPLTNTELKEFLGIITSPDWSVAQRLIHFFALFTGARKQSIFTLRMKHVSFLQSAKLGTNGTYTLRAGPGTGIDTKFDARQLLYVPEQLAEEIVVYANCSVAQHRRDKFKEIYRRENPELEPFKDEDVYLFLSDQGSCFYMAKNDPRYKKPKKPPIGQITYRLKEKLLKSASESFPCDFKFHWLRATYAYQLFQRLNNLVDMGYMTPSEQISTIQIFLHHKNRETTENYLKLFNNVHETMKAQEAYEGILFANLELMLEEGPYGKEKHGVQLDEALKKIVEHKTHEK